MTAADAAHDEVLYKELALLRSQHQAPHPLSPIGRRLHEAAARHEARIAGHEVPAADLTKSSPFSDLTKVLPAEQNRTPTPGTGPDDPFQKAVDGQVEFLNAWGRRRQEALQAAARLAARRRS